MHQHAHHHHDNDDYGWAFAFGVGLNLIFVCVEAAFGWWADSLALLADAGHNLSDVLGLVMAWGGYALAKLPPDSERTCGWRGSTILAALFNALLLLFAIGGIAWEAIGRISEPASVAAPVVIVVAMIGVVINTGTAMLFARGRERHGAWSSWYLNGARETQGQYDHDLPVGRFTWWHENGQKMTEGEYEEGKAVGHWVWWHPNGQKFREGEYTDGAPAGRWTEWAPDGRVAERADYSHGQGSVVQRPTRTAPSTAPRTSVNRLPVNR
jgi:cation diffusion facilitator family transporter